MFLWIGIFLYLALLEMKKRIVKYFWNVLFGLIVLILIIPSWRISFQSQIQRLFMTSIKLDETRSDTISIQRDQWIIYDQNNHPISFHEFGDKPVILNFWATWCPPCIAELPGLYEFYQNVKDDAYVIAISNETIETLKDFKAFQKYNGMIYRSENLLKAFDFSAYPTTFILAPNFRIVSKIIGAENFATEYNVDFIKKLK